MFAGQEEFDGIEFGEQPLEVAIIEGLGLVAQTSPGKMQYSKFRFWLCGLASRGFPVTLRSRFLQVQTEVRTNGISGG